jgi:hypothetical protein
MARAVMDPDGAAFKLVAASDLMPGAESYRTDRAIWSSLS